MITATTQEKATATEIVYGNLARMELTNTTEVASGWITQIKDMGLNHYGFTYNGGDVLHVFLADSNEDNAPATYAFIANTTLGLLSDVYQLEEDGHPENFRVPEGWRRMKDSSVAISLGKITDEDIENESQHVTYIDELLWLLEDARRVAYGEAQVSLLKEVINEMSDGIADWLEMNKRKPPHIEVWSDGELLISSGLESLKGQDVG